MIQGGAEVQWTEYTGMGQTEGPQSKVRGRVRDAAQTVLDRVDRLVYEQIACALHTATFSAYVHV